MTTTQISDTESAVVPEALIYEVHLGRNIYYRGYRDVLVGKLKAEDIMGCSSTQSIILAIISEWIRDTSNRNLLVLSNELGVTLPNGQRRDLDLAVYNNDDNRLRNWEAKRETIAPRLVIEVDTQADLDNEHYQHSELAYIREKTTDLLDFGVEKVIWFSTSKRTLLVSTPLAQTFYDLHETIELIDGLQMNLGEILRKDGWDI